MHVTVPPDASLSPAVAACEPIRTTAAARLNARLRYERPARRSLLMCRVLTYVRHVLTQPRRTSRRDVLEGVMTAAAWRELHMLVHGHALGLFHAAVLELPKNRHLPRDRRSSVGRGQLRGGGIGSSCSCESDSGAKLRRLRKLHR